jgi:CheY-like chemotaxis protein
MRKKLLLADDSITIQKVVELTFPSDEFEVVTAGNGRIAVDKAMTFLPDIVLCDVIMPQLDGYQVCEALRASPELKDVPILLLNGAFEPYDAARAGAVGALGNVSKPFDPPALVARVKEILAQRSARAVEPTDIEDAAAIGTADGASGSSIEAQEFEYDESETHPVSTVEVPMNLRELAARSLSLDAPVFAPQEPEVMTTEAEPSDFSETLHGPLDEEVAAIEELPSSEAMPAVDQVATEPVEESVEAAEETEPVAPTGEFEAPADLAGAETEPVEFESDTVTAEPSLPGTLPPRSGFAPVPSGHEFTGEHEFDPEELGAVGTEAPTSDLPSVEVPAAEAAEYPAEAEPEPERPGLPEELEAPVPRAAAEPEPGPAPISQPAIGLPPPPPPGVERAVQAAPPTPQRPEPGAAPPLPSAEVAVPMDMVQQIAQRVISQVSERVIREIAWDVIPGLAEKLVKAEIERIKARADSERD